MGFRGVSEVSEDFRRYSSTSQGLQEVFGGRCIRVPQEEIMGVLRHLTRSRGVLEHLTGVQKVHKGDLGISGGLKWFLGRFGGFAGAFQIVSRGYKFVSRSLTSFQ